MKHSVAIKTPVDAPKAAFSYARETALREAGNKLCQVLLSDRLPSVVDIEEKTIEGYDLYYPVREYRVEITTTPVSHRHVTMASFQDELWSAQQNVHLTALRVELAWMTFGFITLLMIIIAFIGAR